MKNKPYLIFLSMMIFYSGCDESSSSITGSENVNEITNVTFLNIVTSITENSLEATGVIKNNSQSLSISAPWYIECQFYYNDSLGNTFLIGGASERVNNTLSPGISLQWTLSYGIENPEAFQNFAINDLRAYKN